MIIDLKLIKLIFFHNKILYDVSELKGFSKYHKYLVPTNIIKYKC